MPELTEKSEILLDLVRAGEGKWLKRSDLAAAQGKNRLNVWEIEKLEDMARAGLLEMEQRPSAIKGSLEWVYRYLEDKRFFVYIERPGKPLSIEEYSLAEINTHKEKKRALGLKSGFHETVIEHHGRPLMEIIAVTPRELTDLQQRQVCQHVITWLAKNEQVAKF